jgi:hypothetical protein
VAKSPALTEAWSVGERLLRVTWGAVIWRSVIVVGYIAFALTSSLVLGGGLGVLMFFAVWALVWFAFSRFMAWAEQAQRSLRHRPTSS